MGAESPVKVLVIEDHGELSDIYEFQLRRLGDFEVVCATDGLTGLDLLEESFDVVLMDWQLPNIAGRELLEQLQKRHPGLDVVVVSGFDPPPDVEALPCEAYLVKPVNQREWAEVVDQLDIQKAVV
jgi:CheY-like chemotaxis protein